MTEADLLWKLFILAGVVVPPIVLISGYRRYDQNRARESRQKMWDAINAMHKELAMAIQANKDRMIAFVAREELELRFNRITNEIKEHIDSTFAQHEKTEDEKIGRVEDRIDAVATLIRNGGGK